jgi:membrane AbrB-like protein
MGPLVCAIILAARQSQGSAMPQWTINSAQLLLGWGLGERFKPDFLRTAPPLLSTVALMTAVLLAVAAGSAWLMAQLSGIHVASVLLATTPGGVAEMSITAKGLQLGVPIVTAFHVLRFTYVIVSSATLHAWIKPRWQYKPYG